MLFWGRILVGLKLLILCGCVSAQDSLNSWQFAPDGPSVYSYTEGAICRYHHLLRYPIDYQFYGGIGVWNDIYRSSADFSLGVLIDAKFGGSIRLEDFWIAELPVVLCAKYGCGSQLLNEQPVGIGIGVGPSYYYNSSEPAERFIRPLWILEISIRIARQRFFVRYSELFTTPLFVRKSIALGGYIPIKWN